MGFHFALEERFDALAEGYALGVAQLWIGLRVAILIAANSRGLIALAKVQTESP